jgi:hypothetical protein
MIRRVSHIHLEPIVCRIKHQGDSLIHASPTIAAYPQGRHRPSKLVNTQIGVQETTEMVCILTLLESRMKAARQYAHVHIVNPLHQKMQHVHFDVPTCVL